VRSVAQPVAAPLTRAAIFLVATLKPGPESLATVKSFCADLAALVCAVEFRDLEGGLSCVVGFGSDAWNALSTEAQERIIGRTKLSNIELDDAIKPTSAHNAPNTIMENGKEVKILRDNMPFGRPGHGEFGTYFIGYSRSPRTIEQMLENMFIGRPPGNCDRLLDFSRAVTGNLFFVPTATFLEAATDDSPAIVTPSTAPALGGATPSGHPDNDGSLGIGSLKGDIHHE
jgi:putative iron-dependent peroxidase